MRVLITGADGFIGKNLQIHLNEREIETVSFTRDTPIGELSELVKSVDFVFHLAGVNRPKDVSEFTQGNKNLTEQLCAAIESSGKIIPVLFSSSIHINSDSEYGETKKAAETALISLEKKNGSPVYIYRLPNVFGKWSRPNYNSVVATFCYNIANDLQININDETKILKLVYIDDVMIDFINQFLKRPKGLHTPVVEPIYSISVGALAQTIHSFKASRRSLFIDSVGEGLTRALYSSYLSFLKPENFSYGLMVNDDPRGRFVEMLKTKNSGQISFFTAYPGVTRGKHYHHTKNEKFLVVKGSARFRFRNILTDELYEKFTNDVNLEVVETVPGWVHEIKNVGSDEMIVLLWANEVFDQMVPDTTALEVDI